MGLSKDSLDQVVDGIKRALSDPGTRILSQRAVQGKIWHEVSIVSKVLSDLRAEEETARRAVLDKTSVLVYKFHSLATEATLARAGLILDPRIHAGSSLEKKDSIDVLCLDAKERLYIILKVRKHLSSLCLGRENADRTASHHMYVV
jgi:hypothetical protein